MQEIEKAISKLLQDASEIGCKRFKIEVTPPYPIYPNKPDGEMCLGRIEILMLIEEDKEIKGHEYEIGQTYKSSVAYPFLPHARK